MKCSEQTALWVQGRSIHNTERDECCPDFSCCTPELLAPLEERKRFHLAELAGDEKLKNEMLMGFLGKMIKSAKLDPIKVHIAGQMDGSDKPSN